MGSVLLIYSILTIIVLLLGVLAAFNFLRFRFKNDKTITLIVIFAVAFILNVAFTLALLHSDQPRPTSENTNPDFIF